MGALGTHEAQEAVGRAWRNDHLAGFRHKRIMDEAERRGMTKVLQALGYGNQPATGLDDLQLRADDLRRLDRRHPPGLAGGVAPDNTTNGYWMAAADGGIFTFWRRRVHVSPRQFRLTVAIVPATGITDHVSASHFRRNGDRRARYSNIESVLLTPKHEPREIALGLRADRRS
jgi:hypothetical protein